MSGVKELMERLQSDEELNKVLSESTSPEEFLSKAKEAGFDVTSEDMESLFVPEVFESETGELSDDDLDQVSGGRILTVANSKISGNWFQNIAQNVMRFGKVIEPGRFEMSSNGHLVSGGNSTASTVFITPTGSAIKSTDTLNIGEPGKNNKILC